MAAINHNPIFQARWTLENEHLKPKVETKLGRIWRVVYNVFSVLIPVILVARLVGWAVTILARKAILPAAFFYSPQQLQEIRDLFDMICFGPVNNENRQFRENFTVTRHQVVTSDGKKLSAIHFQHNQADESTETLLYFQPNLAISELFVHSWLLQEAMTRNLPHNFVVFDNRSVSLSEGSLERPTEDLLIDGDSMFQFTRDHLQVPVHLIKGYGWSLGGSTSASVRAIHPEWNTRYVNERSFSSTRETVAAWLTGLKKLFFFWFPFAMDRSGCNVKTPIDKVQGEIMIVYHEKDETTPYEGSTHQAAVMNRVRFQSIKLTTSHYLHVAEIMGFRVYHHAHPLKDYVVTTRESRPADQVIADFILGLPRPRALPAAANVA